MVRVNVHAKGIEEARGEEGADEGMREGLHGGEPLRGIKSEEAENEVDEVVVASLEAVAQELIGQLLHLCRGHHVRIVHSHGVVDLIAFVP